MSKAGLIRPRLLVSGVFSFVVGALSIACAANPPRFATTASLPASAPFHPEQFVPPTLTTQAAPTWGARQSAIDTFFLGLNLNDKTTVVSQLTPDCQLKHPTKSPVVTSEAVWDALARPLHAPTSGGSAASHLLDHTTISAPSLSDRVLVEVRGAPTLNGQWTFVFSATRTAAISEILLPTRP